MRDEEFISEVEYEAAMIEPDDAFQALEGVPALDLYLAEIELMAHGLREEDIKEIGKLYAKLLQEESVKLRDNLPQDHPLVLFLKEHEQIEDFLEILEKITTSLKNHGMGFNVREAVLHNLDEMESHFIREEEVLFKGLKQVLGDEVSPRLSLLKREHGEIRLRRKRIMGIENPEKHELIRELNAMIYMLHHHKFMEDNMLYPVAAHVLKDWTSLEKKAKDIGHCNFVDVPV
ncbi:MAG: hemerythrin domain-containing protein [Thermoplasmata archaeon]